MDSQCHKRIPDITTICSGLIDVIPCWSHHLDLQCCRNVCNDANIPEFTRNCENDLEVLIDLVYIVYVVTIYLPLPQDNLPQIPPVNYLKDYTYVFLTSQMWRMHHYITSI
jgi:hypothetical protein